MQYQLEYYSVIREIKDYASVSVTFLFCEMSVLYF